MNERRLLKMICVVAALLYGAAGTTAQERHPNLVIIQTDEHNFRTLGCYPLTGAVESVASTVPEIIEEMLRTRHSERQGRVIDHDEAGSMEEKKREGYF